MTNQNTNNIQPSVVINPAAHNLPNQQQQPQLLINQRNNNPNGHHQSQLLQNCTNLMPNTNSNGLQSPSCIWGHPGLQPEFVIFIIFILTCKNILNEFLIRK